MLVFHDTDSQAQFNRHAGLALADPFGVRLEDGKDFLGMGDAFSQNDPASGLVDLPLGMRDEVPPRECRTARRSVSTVTATRPRYPSSATAWTDCQRYRLQPCRWRSARLLTALGQVMSRNWMAPKSASAVYCVPTGECIRDRIAASKATPSELHVKMRPNGVEQMALEIGREMQVEECVAA